MTGNTDVVNISGNVLTLPRFVRVGGYPDIADQGVSFYQLVHPADSLVVQQAVARCE